jgi:hypothetical protein
LCRLIAAIFKSFGRQIGLEFRASVNNSMGRERVTGVRFSSIYERKEGNGFTWQKYDTIFRGNSNQQLRGSSSA